MTDSSTDESAPTGVQGSAQLLSKTISKMNSRQLRDLMGSRTMLEAISLRDWLVGAVSESAR